MSSADRRKKGELFFFFFFFFCPSSDVDRNHFISSRKIKDLFSFGVRKVHGNKNKTTSEV